MNGLDGPAIIDPHLHLFDVVTTNCQQHTRRHPYARRTRRGPDPGCAGCDAAEAVGNDSAEGSHKRLYQSDGKEQHPSLQRRVTKRVLHIERQKKGAPEHPHTKDKQDSIDYREVEIPEKARTKIWFRQPSSREDGQISEFRPL